MECLVVKYHKKKNWRKLKLAGHENSPQIKLAFPSYWIFGLMAALMHWSFILTVWLLRLRIVSFQKMLWLDSLRKQPTFCNATTGFHLKWCLGNEHRNSILKTDQYPDQGSASDSLAEANFPGSMSLRHHFAGKPVVSVKCWLFSEASDWLVFECFGAKYEFW